MKWTSLFSLLFYGFGLFGAERGWNSLELAKIYFQHSEPQRNWAWQLLKRVRFEGSERILDFGCGDRKITAELSCLVPQGHVVGVDLSSSTILLANIHFPKHLYDNLEFLQIELESNDPLSGFFDVIRCSFVINFKVCFIAAFSTKLSRRDMPQISFV